MFKIIISLLSIPAILGLNALFNHWTCIGIKNNIDFSKPYKINVGELPLVVWQNRKTKDFTTTLNICKHLGSRLDNGDITYNGCLKCKYHGLEYTNNDNFGETVEYQGKIFWAFNPSDPLPHSIPFHDDSNYAKSYIEIDMEASLIDCALNTMDLRHPEYVHGGMFGFGSSKPPLNIKQYKSADGVGLEFDYQSKLTSRVLNGYAPSTKNIHMFTYPTFTWSKVSFVDKSLVIAVNFLPLGIKKTRWYVTICHNYLQSPLGKEFMKSLSYTILNQDFIQMKNQYIDNPLKKEVLLNHVFSNEDAILWLYEMFQEYKYPDTQDCVELYKTDKDI